MDKQLNIFAEKLDPKEDKWVIFTDGASRGNPGPSGAGIYAEHNKKEVLSESVFLGTKTNNQAEYLALALGIYFIRKKVKPSNLEIISDSELLIKQMKGEYKVKDKTLRQLKNIIISLLEGFTCSFTHVLRVNNKKADKLANIAVDEKSKMPKEFIAILVKHNCLI